MRGANAATQARFTSARAQGLEQLSAQAGQPPADLAAGARHGCGRAAGCVGARHCGDPSVGRRAAAGAGGAGIGAVNAGAAAVRAGSATGTAGNAAASAANATDATACAACNAVGI